MIQEINEHLLLKENNEGACNVYAIVYDSFNILIDTGLYILDLYDEKYSVFNTHAYLDHVGNNYLFDNIFLHPKAEEKIRNNNLSSSLIGGLKNFKYDNAFPKKIIF